MLPLLLLLLLLLLRLLLLPLLPLLVLMLLLLLLHCHYETSSGVVQGKLGGEEVEHTIAHEVEETTLPEE